MRTFVSDAVKVPRSALEGDGVGVRLFELLWKRDLFSDSSLSLCIPDTIIFRYSAPSVWYFTSVDGTIKRKTKAKVNSEHIFEEFLKKQSASGILACYVYSLHAEHEPEPENGDQDPSAATRTTIEYLDRDGLWRLLFDRQKVRPDGILQKFVEPKGDRNNMIRVLWSPKVCLLERRINHKRLSDTKFDVYERAVTFEGSDFLSEVTPVRGPSMVMQVHDIADSVVSHIAAVTGDKMKISRMALNFKVDDRDRLWLLFASSIRLRDELKFAKLEGRDHLMESGISNTPLEANAILQVPSHVRRIGTTMTSRPAALQCKSRCPTCEEKVEGSGLCDVSFKVIIEHEERKRGIAATPLPAPIWPQWPPKACNDGCSNDSRSREEIPQQKLLEVPEPLLLLHPRLTSEEYTRFRHDVAFLYKAASVCESCYLRFSAPQLGAQWKQTIAGLGAGDSEEVVELACPPFKGIEALNPDRLRKRQQATERRVLKHKAVEEGQWDDMLRCRTEKPPKKAKSCPKLPSWGPGHNGPVVNPPSGVLDSRPQPPRGAAPLWVDLRPGRMSPNLLAEMSPQRRRKVPKLLGAPYLRDLQAFAVNCPSRAHQVIPSMAPTAGARRDRHSGSSYDAVPHAMSPAPGAADEALETQLRRPRLRPDSADAHPEYTDLYSEVPEPPTRNVPLALDMYDDIMEDVDTDPLVANLWEKWPDSCDTAGSSRARTPTTRPPSAADGRLSSLPTSTNSRTSSRPMSGALSRAWSAQSSSRPSRPPSHRNRAMQAPSGRPLSSPPVGRQSAGERQEPAALHRPSSSPQFRPGSAKPPLARARPVDRPVSQEGNTF